MNKEKFAKLFPFGSHLCREPMPAMAELKSDMENLKKHSFNLVKLQEHWMIDEPLEGRVDLSKYEELIAHAAKLDMGVYLGLTCEQAPGWLYEKYPDARMVGRNGLPIIYEAQTTLPADGKPGPCYDHSGAMADQLRFIRALVNTLGKYENIVVWNTWQEIAYWPEQGAGQPVCFCENTMNFFRQWLEEKYGDLDGLNRAWNSRYGDWRFLKPDRGAYGQNALPNDVDWRYFMDNVQIANVLRARAQAIRESDPMGRPVFAHKGAMAIGYAHDWTYADCQDFVGTSTYPAWRPIHSWDDGAYKANAPQQHDALLAEMHGVALSFDYLRSCNKKGAPVWAAEFQGGPVSTFLHKGRIPSAEDLRRWMLTAIASGVTGISFWVTRAEIMAQETNGFSLLDSQGDSSPRYEEAARIGAVLNQQAEVFAPSSLAKAQVGIVVNEWNAQFCSTYPPALSHLQYSTRGWHRLLWQNGFPVDFVNIEAIDAHTVDQHHCLILPVPLSLSEESAERLRQYVAAGGNLLCEACPGRIDENGTARRGELSPIMRELLQVEHASLVMAREPGDQTRWMPQERTWGEFCEAAVLQGEGVFAGHALNANFYLETYLMREAEAIFTYHGKIGGTRRRYGKGQAFLIGTFVGHNALAYHTPAVDDFVMELMRLSQVEVQKVGELLMRTRRSGGKTAILLSNLTEKPVSETLPVPFGSVDLLVGQKMEQDGQQVTMTVDSLDVCVVLLDEE